MNWVYGWRKLECDQLRSPQLTPHQLVRNWRCVANDELGVCGSSTRVSTWPTGATSWYHASSQKFAGMFHLLGPQRISTNLLSINEGQQRPNDSHHLVAGYPHTNSSELETGEPAFGVGWPWERW